MQLSQITTRPRGISEAVLREAKHMTDRMKVDGLARVILTTRESLSEGVPHVVTRDDHAVEARYAARMALAMLDPDVTLQATLRAREAMSAYWFRRDYATLHPSDKLAINRAVEEVSSAFVWTYMGIVSDLKPGNSRREELSGPWGVR